jgi:ornithine decarboxylase
MRPLDDLARRTLEATGLSTPLLLIDRDHLRANLDRWTNYVPDAAPHYAVKANVDPLVLREVCRHGAGADVASAFELEAAVAVGFTGGRMILSNPRKDLDTIQAMHTFRPWATVVDSEEEILKLGDAGIPTADYRPTLFIRIKVPTRGVKQDLSTKFGIRVLDPDAGPGEARRPALRLAELRAVCTAAVRAGFQDLGLAFHVGTQCADPRVYHAALALCREVAQELSRNGVSVRAIDMGGGIADARVAAEHNGLLTDLVRETGRKAGQAAALEGLAGRPAHDKLLYLIGLGARAAVRDGFHVVAEPGRYLVADSGTLLTRVIYDRATEITGRRVQIDDGVYRTLSGRVHDGRDFEFAPLRLDPHKPPLAAARVMCAVWGCSCDSFDKVSDGQPLPADLGVGDFLAIGCTGAYSTSFGSNTNGFEPATVVMHWDDGGRLEWAVSPLGNQNRTTLDRIRDWMRPAGPEGETS